MSETRTVDELIDGLIFNARDSADLVRRGDGEFHLRTLLGVRDWAYAQQPHQPGDRVRLIVEIDFEKAYGWRPHAEHLQKGAVGTVEDIGFNLHSKSWYANVRMDTDPKSTYGFNQSSLGREIGEADG